ncbi:flagellar biosynthesis protein FlhF [Cohnella sp. REN36]|uniref:flagellar biosynthesis protein FlhF n=1 Tax=Cohnella sp. REN36 TaxID=2887347 RepID=UPI001D1462B0|nr:flagellar biosynthesis protein FlhF [Cohnella sp. REN36]MCC3376220.1 flagellar biosynthesis protein FlhF [Cohnella sp. REN36]
MKVKRYLVGDLPEAVQLIRSELGSDAVILNTKEIRTGGFLGMFRKKRVEVIAAVDEKEAAKPSYRAPMSRPAAPSSAAERAQRPPLPATKPPAASVLADDPPAEEARQAPLLPPGAIRQRYGGSAEAAPLARPQASPGQTEPPEPAQRPSARTAAGPGEARASGEGASMAAQLAAVLSDSLRGAAHTEAAAAKMPSAPTKATAAPPAGDAATETAALLAELRELKAYMQRANREQSQRAMPEAVLALSRRLAVQGVEPVYVEQFAEAVTARLAERNEAEAGSNDETAYALGAALLREWLAPAADDGLSAETKIVNFVGPTGVGKTTTIAKLGAEQAFVHRRSVGFITADTYRIAAVDQLRTYADILNVPLEVVFSPSELTRAYKKLEDRDLLFMDTAGRNYRNELFVSEVNSLLAPGQKAETFLVLSLTHKYGDMRQVAENFARYGVHRLLLTKMDETDSYGAMLNLVMEFGFQIPYVTFGQTVPDDIRRFDADALIAKLLGDAADA